MSLRFWASTLAARFHKRSTSWRRGLIYDRNVERVSVPSHTRCHQVNIWCACASKASPISSETPPRPRIASKSRNNCPAHLTPPHRVPVVGTVAICHQDAENSRPTARAPPAHVTSALKHGHHARHRHPQPGALVTLAPAGLIDAPRFALGRKRGLPPRARLPPRSWLAPTG